MKTDNHSLQVKRSYKKIVSLNVAIKLKVYIENKINRKAEEIRKREGNKNRFVTDIFIKREMESDMRFIKRMNRQIICSNYLTVYDNDVVKSKFCNQKTCLICNSIRLSKFLTKYLDLINQEKVRYHMVLSIKNPSGDNLKNEIDRMYKFFNQSSIKRNKRYKELNQRIKMIRSFEATLNTKAKSFNIHFHILLAGESKEELKEYGEIIIEYWLKYFGDKANRKAQYLEEQYRSVLENFKYLVKLKDLQKGHLPMFYELLKATEGKRLFTAKNFKRNKVNKELEEVKFNDVENANVLTYYTYKGDQKNWVDEDTGEIFVDDEKIKFYENEIEEKKNLFNLKKYFSDMSLNKAHKNYILLK